MSGFAGLWRHRPRGPWGRVLCQDRAGPKVDPWGPGAGSQTKGHSQVHSMGSKLHADPTAWGGPAGVNVGLGLRTQRERPPPTLPPSPAVLRMPGVPSPGSRGLGLGGSWSGGE